MLNYWSLVKNILAIDGVESMFLGSDFLSINKNEKSDWENIKHIAISLINEFYEDGNELIIDKNSDGTINPDLIYFIDSIPKPGGDIRSKDYQH